MKRIDAAVVTVAAVLAAILNYWLMLAEGHLTRTRFAAMLQNIALLPLPAV